MLLSENQLASLTEFLQESRVDCHLRVDLAQFSYMKTGGIAQIVIFPRNAFQLVSVVRYLASQNLQFKTIGNMSNLLFLDGVQYSILVSTIKVNAITYDRADGVFAVECGAMLPDLSRRALHESVVGYEGFEGIPGTAGGGVFMNAGAYGCELKDVLLSAELVRPSGETISLASPEFKFGFRSSILQTSQSGNIVCKLYLCAEKGDAGKIYRRMELYHAKRHKYLEYMYPNLGSLFAGSPYRALGERDRIFKLISAIYYLFNYKLKLFRRESPLNRKWLNDIVVKRFGLQYAVQPFSDKTLNCLVNRGQGTGEMVRFIQELQQLTGGRLPLENEIVEEI